LLDESSSISGKLDPSLNEIMTSEDCPDTLSVIVQTIDQPNADDEQLVRMWKGRILETFTIIPAFVAELSPGAIRALLLSKRIRAISNNTSLG
jgi:hypothetical protein